MATVTLIGRSRLSEICHPGTISLIATTVDLCDQLQPRVPHALTPRPKDQQWSIGPKAVLLGVIKML